jgi:archaemetzincin
MMQSGIRVAVIPLGYVPDIAPKVIAAHITGIFNIFTDILAPLEHPQYAFDQRRIQYNAGSIIKALESGKDDPLFADYEKVIGILNVDIFIPIFTHVLGEARQGEKFALVSLFRLEHNMERAGKIALHELGHLCNLEHCMDSKCLMHFSKGIAELDSLPLYFCPYCSLFINRLKQT